MYKSLDGDSKKKSEDGDEDKDKDENKDGAPKPKTVKEFMKEYNGIFESISLFNLNKERPIVPLKVLITELEL
jgi:hypothetical protein